MLKLESNIHLKKFNTFGIQATAKYFVQVPDKSDLLELSHFLKSNQISHLPRLILGGGSNLIFSQDFHGVVIQPLFDHKGITHTDEDWIYVSAQAGANWNQFVHWSLKQNIQGLENLVLIPGSVGAAPVQNIGAYGAEIKDFIQEVEYFDLESSTFHVLKNSECRFSYRDSLFKHELKDKALITEVRFQFPKKPKFKIDYGELATMLNPPVTAEKIAQVITSIRQSKLPDPAIIGNVGSFFHNPIIDSTHANKLNLEYPQMPQYKIDSTRVKIPAGWLIDQCGWKGKSVGNVGVYEKQALVLVNRGDAKGEEVLHLAKLIQKSVFDKFQIQLSIEPIIL